MLTSTVGSTAMEDEATRLLQRLAGPGARWRDGQLEAVLRVTAGGRALVVQRTGWGKSAVYFVATKMLRDRGAGVTLLVSPLLALMRNQIDAAERLGLVATTINSTNRGDWRDVEARLADGAVDILLVSPERLANERFRDQLTTTVAPDSGLLVIDEAHCISDWGHDFRPDYRRVARVLSYMPAGVPLLCTTATANTRVVEDITDQLGAELMISRGTLDRESLALDVLDIPSQSERMAWVAQALGELPGTGIIYALTIHDAERLAAFLAEVGHDVAAYSGRTPDGARKNLERRLITNQIKALVATSALGMGYDKPDLSFVIHFQSPGSPIAYYQQVGRAGRALDRAHGILLLGDEDQDIQGFFISSAFPSRATSEEVVAALEAESLPRSMSWIEGRVNVRRSRLETLLKVLEVDGAIIKQGSAYTRTARPWTYDQDRVDRVTAQRRLEQQVMATYPHADCLMAELRRVLDDPHVSPCGRCARCLGRPLLAIGEPPEALVGIAERYVRGTSLTVEPRKRWPKGPGAGVTAIPDDLQVQPGKVLARWGSTGWGPAISRGKYRFGAFGDDLIGALTEVVRRWSPEPEPAWVTWVPSDAHPRLVTDMAREVADRLRLPAVDAVQTARTKEPQKSRENSVQQFMNVDGAFRIAPGAVYPGPVLLIDDVIDSRWTMTVIGAALRAAGSGPVHPLALAVAASG
ncbi:MAG: RecQ family ATP-dependent DNA helicase [Euzebya sp.]